MNHFVRLDEDTGEREEMSETPNGQSIVIGSIRLSTNFERVDEVAGVLLSGYIAAAEQFVKTHDPECKGCPGMRLHQTLLVKAKSIVNGMTPGALA